MCSGWLIRIVRYCHHRKLWIALSLLSFFAGGLEAGRAEMHVQDCMWRYLLIRANSYLSPEMHKLLRSRAKQGITRTRSVEE